MVHAAQALALRATGSPRTDHDMLKINYLAVRPELIEGRSAKCDTVDRVEKKSIERRVLCTLRFPFAEEG